MRVHSAGKRLPDREAPVRTVRLKQVLYDVVVRHSGQTVVFNRHAAAVGILVEQYVVDDRVARTAVRHQQRPASIFGHDDRIVYDDVVGRGIGRIADVQNDSGRVVVVQQIVTDDAVLETVEVQSGP